MTLLTIEPQAAAPTLAPATDAIAEARALLEEAAKGGVRCHPSPRRAVCGQVG